MATAANSTTNVTVARRPAPGCAPGYDDMISLSSGGIELLIDVNPFTLGAVGSLTIDADQLSITDVAALIAIFRSPELARYLANLTPIPVVAAD